MEAMTEALARNGSKRTNGRDLAVTAFSACRLIRGRLHQEITSFHVRPKYIQVPKSISVNLRASLFLIYNFINWKTENYDREQKTGANAIAAWLR